MELQWKKQDLPGISHCLSAWLCIPEHFSLCWFHFLSGGTSIITIAVTAFLMNSRQTFYSLTFVDEFKKMGKRLLYMIHTMTDETYAVNLSLTETGKKKRT